MLLIEHEIDIPQYREDNSLLVYFEHKIKAGRSLVITSLAKKLEMSLANIGLSVERGELIAKDGNCSLEK